MQQKLFQNFFISFYFFTAGNNIGKEPQKHAQNRKYMNIKYLQGIFALPAIQYKW